MRRKKEPVNENGIAIRKGVLPDKTTRITISNQLIEASNKLSLLQLWILFVLISNIDRRDNVFMEYGFYAKDLARAFNMEEKHCYDAMKKAVKGLVSSYVTVKSEGMSGSVEEDIPWVHNAIYRPHNALIVLRLNDGLRPHLLQLRKNFTSFNLYYLIHRFENKDALKLFMFAYSRLKKENFKKQRYLDGCSIDFTISEWVKFFSLSDKWNSDNIKRKKLQPAADEISKIQDLPFKMEVRRKTRHSDNLIVDLLTEPSAISNVTFMPLQINLLPETEEEAFAREESARILNDLYMESAGVVLDDAIESGMSYSEILRNIQYVRGKYFGKPNDEIVALITEAIRKDYAKNLL